MFDNKNTDNSIYCFFDANESTSITILLSSIPIYVAIVATLFWVRIRHRDNKIFNNSQRQVNFIFILVFLWAFRTSILITVYGSMLTINISVYFTLITGPAPDEVAII